MLYHRFVYRKNWFRCIYIGGLTVNLLLPLINSVLVKMPGFQKILSISELLSGKEGVGINGRERLWEMALTIANDSPILAMEVIERYTLIIFNGCFARMGLACIYYLYSYCYSFNGTFF